MSCPCGLRLEEGLCGAYSESQRPQHSAPQCWASCERPSLKAFPSGARGEPEKYALDFQQLASHHRRYVQTLEDQFAVASGLGSGPAAAKKMPPCDATRRLLAVEYGRLYWRLRVVSKADVAEGWWSVQIQPLPGARPPWPLLSDTASLGGGGASLAMQPRLRFTGVRNGTAGDEVYDLVGLDGLIGLRQGNTDGEVVAFVDRSATAVTVFKKLTGQAPGVAPVPVRSSNTGNAWGGAGVAPAASTSASGLRVVLENPLTGVGADVNASARRSNARKDADGWDAKAPESGVALAIDEDVPEDWDDES